MFIKFKKIPITEFCSNIGVSAAYVNSIRSSIQPDKIKSIALNYPELSTAWLLAGQGEMLNHDVAAPVAGHCRECDKKQGRIELLQETLGDVVKNYESLKAAYRDLELQYNEKLKRTG